MLPLPTLALIVQQSAVDLSTPEKAVKAFAAALAARDVDGMASCIFGAHLTPSLKEGFRAQRDIPGLKVLGSRQTSLSDSRVRLAVTLRLISPDRNEKLQKTVQDEIVAVRERDSWRLLPPGEGANLDRLGILESFALIFAHPAALERARTAARAATALSNMKQVVIAGLMHTNDYDEKYFLTPGNFVKALTPYLKSKFVLTSPLDPPGTVSFSINPNLTKDSFPMLAHPEKTVWFFEGRPGELKFRYEGKALISFCDGHVARVTPEEAKSLLWK